MQDPRIALTYNLFTGNGETEFDFDTPDTIDWLVGVLRKHGLVTTHNVNASPAQWIPDITNANPSVVFNVAEGYKSAAREAFYPSLFEQLGFKYCGPGPTELLICLNKHLTKYLLASNGIRVAQGVVLHEPSVDVLSDMAYPVIVKPNFEGSSLGIDERAVCKSMVETREQIQKLAERLEDAVVVEQFIEGDDYSISFVEGIGVLGPVKYVLPPNTKDGVHDFRLKVFDHHDVELCRPSDLNQDAIEEVRHMCERAVEILNIMGYCRFDVRINREGMPFVLEVNGQVSFNPYSSFLQAAALEGIEAERVVSVVLAQGLSRKRRSCVPCRGYVVI